MCQRLSQTVCDPGAVGKERVPTLGYHPPVPTDLAAQQEVVGKAATVMLKGVGGAPVSKGKKEVKAQEHPYTAFSSVINRLGEIVRKPITATAEIAGVFYGRSAEQVDDEFLIGVLPAIIIGTPLPCPIEARARVDILNLLRGIYALVNAVDVAKKQEALMMETLDKVARYDEDELTRGVAGCEESLVAECSDNSAFIEHLLRVGGYTEGVSLGIAVVEKAAPIIARCKEIAKNALAKNKEAAVLVIVDLLPQAVESCAFREVFFDNFDLDAIDSGAVEEVLSEVGYPEGVIAAEDPRVLDAVRSFMVALSAKKIEIDTAKLSKFFQAGVPHDKLVDVARLHGDEIIGFDTLRISVDSEYKASVVRTFAEWFGFPLEGISDFSGVLGVEEYISALVDIVAEVDEEKVIGERALFVSNQLGAITSVDRDAFAEMEEETLLRLGRAAEASEFFPFVVGLGVAPGVADLQDNGVVINAVHELYLDLFQRAVAIDMAKKAASVVECLTSVPDANRDALVVQHEAALAGLDLDKFDFAGKRVIVRNLGLVSEDLVSCLELGSPEITAAIDTLLIDLRDRAVMAKSAREVAAREAQAQASRESEAAARDKSMKVEPLFQRLGQIRDLPVGDTAEFVALNEEYLVGFSLPDFERNVRGVKDRGFAIVRESGLVDPVLADGLDPNDKKISRAVMLALSSLADRARVARTVRVRAEAEAAGNKRVEAITSRVVGTFVDTPDYLASVVEAYADDMTDFDPRAFDRNRPHWVGVFVQVACLTDIDGAANTILNDYNLRALACRVLISLNEQVCSARKKPAVQVTERQGQRPQSSVVGVSDNISQRASEATKTGAAATVEVRPLVLKNKKQGLEVLATMRQPGGIQSRRGVVDAAWTTRVEAACDTVLRTLGGVVQGDVAAKQMAIAVLFSSEDNLPEALRFNALTGQPLNQPRRR